MNKVKSLIVSGHGTNCERETAFAAQKAGADCVEVLHFSKLRQEEVSLTDFNFLIFPGGFLDGDQLGAAQAAANRYLYAQTPSGRSLADQIQEFHARGGLILGICNGFQLLTKLGLLPAVEKQYLSRQASLTYNNSARFEDRWVYLRCNPDSPCIFTHNLRDLYLPVRHGEGKVTFLNSQILDKVRENGQIAMQYCNDLGEVSVQYPDNPNGSPWGIAGLTDLSGQIFGLMPHPEAFNHVTNYPMWTRAISSSRKSPGIFGTAIFENAVSYLRKAG